MFSKFSLQVHKVIFNSFPETYFVGGAVRNLLIGEKFSDYDIATIATPTQVLAELRKNKISFSNEHQKLGVIIAKRGTQKVEITTFRKDKYLNGRFPRVTFVKSAKIDSNRRDFTINAIYFNPQTKEILDYHEGLLDLQKRTLKFIGKPTVRIKEDPLRIVRGFRFQLQYNFKFESITQRALNKNKVLLKNISASRVKKEIDNIKVKSLQKELQKVIHSST